MIKTSEMWFELNPNEFVRNFNQFEVRASHDWEAWRFCFDNWTDVQHIYYLHKPADIDAEEMDLFCDKCLAEIDHPIIYQIYGTKDYKAEELTEDICNNCPHMLREWVVPSWPLTLKWVIAWLEAEWYAITEIMPMIRFLRTDKWFDTLHGWDHLNFYI